MSADRFGIAASIFFLLISSVLPLRAQSTYGSILGTVHDPSGSVIPTAKVTVTNTGTSASRSTTTDNSGDYTVVNLDPGNYEVAIDAPGFQKATYSGIQLSSRQTVRVDGNVALASQANTVSIVAAGEAPIQTEVSNITEVKLGRELNDLPVAIASRASGSTSALSTLTNQPGVEIDNNGSISVAGTKPSMLSVTIDGISSMSPRNSAPIAELFPSFDGIAEIRVSEINNAAEFGGVSDITTISKGGTNRFHGSLFENNQNTAYDARNTFSATVPKLDMNNFGGSIGGPVTLGHVYNGRDKTFFFADYEAMRLPRQVVLVENQPTASMRNGDLSLYPAGSIKDPTTGQPFANNLIPQNRISPLATLVMKYFDPLPNNPSTNPLVGNYVVNFPTPISSNQGDLRIDQNITTNQSVFARFTYKQRDVQNIIGSQASPTGSPLLGPFAQPENDYAVTGAWNYVISPRMVNELRGGISGNDFKSDYTTFPDAKAVADQLGLTPFLPQGAPAGNAVPSFPVTGFQGTGGGGSSSGTASVHISTATYQVLDNLTWTHGHHTIKFGGDYRYMTALYTNVFSTTRLGIYTFSNSSVTSGAIGNPFAAFLLGIPDKTQIASVLSPDMHGYASLYSFYVQDDWKLTPRITVNYGLRYEYHPMFKDHGNNVANFLPDYTSTVNGQTLRGAMVIPDDATSLVNPAVRASLAPLPIVTASQAGVPQSLRYSEKTDFAPRIGIAWRATADGKTVVRGGWGIFIEPELGNLLFSSYCMETCDSVTFNNKITNGVPLYTLSNPFPPQSSFAQPGTFQFNLANDLHYQDPKIQQWNLTVERDLGFATGIRLSYEGSHSGNLGVQTNPNQVPVNSLGYNAVAATTTPYPQIGQILYLTNAGRANYNAFTTSVNKRMSKGLQFQVSYNLAKNLSNAGGFNPTTFASSGGGQTTDNYNPGLDYGNVSFTRRQRFQTTFLYESPFGKMHNRIVSQVAGGWEIAGVLLFQTGPFLSVLASGADPSGTNFANIQGNGRADITSGVSVVPDNQNINNWVNKAAFSIPANNIGRFGTAPVGDIVGPGTQSVALSLYRSFKVGERVSLRIGAAASNLFNHPNYGTPSLTLGTSAFGTITSLQTQDGAGPRGLQLTGRITF